MTIYRGRVRLTIQAAGCGLAAVLFASATVLAWSRWAYTLASLAAMITFAMLAMYIPRTRIEADTAGITLHTITGCAFYSWGSIALIGVFRSEAESGPLAVYAPSLRLIDGRDIELTPVGCYRRSTAAAIGALLDARRRNQFEAATADSNGRSHEPRSSEVSLGKRNRGAT